MTRAAAMGHGWRYRACGAGEQAATQVQVASPTRSQSKRGAGRERGRGRQRWRRVDQEWNALLLDDKIATPDCTGKPGSRSRSVPCSLLRGPAGLQIDGALLFLKHPFDELRSALCVFRLIANYPFDCAILQDWGLPVS